MHIGFDGRCIQDHFPGIGRYAYSLIEAMSRLDQKDNFTILQASEALDSRFNLSVLAKRGNVQLVPTDCSYFGIEQHLAVPKLARRLAFDLYHSPYYMRPRSLPCPTVTTLHDIIPIVVRGAEPNGLKRALYRHCVKMAVRRSDEIIVDSAVTERDTLACFPAAKGKITVIPLAADALQTIVSNEPPHPLGIERPFVLAVGTNKPHKGLSDLIQAWQALPDSLLNTHQLVLAGPRLPGEYATPLNANGVSIIETGTVTESVLNWLYDHAELFVFPSHYEGFGLPVLEAMMHNTPVLARDTATAREVAGDAAVYFTDNLPQSIAALLHDEPKRYALVQAGAEQAKQFSWEETARRTLKVYRRAVMTL